LDVARLTGSFFIGSAISLSAIASVILARSDWMFITTSFSVVLFVVYLANLAKRNLFFAACCMPVLFNYLWFVISFVLFELGAYTPELRMTGHATGGTARLVLFLYIFVVGAEAAFNHIRFPNINSEHFEKRLSAVLPAGALVALAIVLIYAGYGTAFSNSVDRIQYRATVAPKVFSQIVTVLVFLSFFLGLLRRVKADRNKPVRMIDALFVGNLILLALGGEKFSLLFTSISLYIAPLFYMRKVIFNFRMLSKYFLIGLVVLAVIISLAVNQYMGLVGGNVWDIIGQLLIDRVAQQAQLNFFFDNMVFVDGVARGNLFSFVENEILALASSGNYRGIQFLMNAAAPSDLFGIYAEAGVTFGDGFPGILFYYFSWYTVFAMAVFGIVYGLFTALCLREALQGRLVSGLVLFYMFYNIFLSAFLNGELYLLLEMTPSKIIAALILLFALAIRWHGGFRPLQRE
jgi:hypothetical protein